MIDLRDASSELQAFWDGRPRTSSRRVLLRTVARGDALPELGALLQARGEELQQAAMDVVAMSSGERLRLDALAGLHAAARSALRGRPKEARRLASAAARRLELASAARTAP